MSAAGSAHRITYREAMRQAIRAALQADVRVFLMGEDVGRSPGAAGSALGNGIRLEIWLSPRTRGANVDTKDISARVLALLTDVAPDIDPAAVVPDRNLRDQFDFDSMDTLHFATAISREFGIDVAERDYAQLASIAKACDYVRRKVGERGRI